MATAVLAIAGAKVAGTPKLGTWLVLVGAAMLMYLADTLRGIEDMARDLAHSSGHDLSRTRSDVVMSHGLWRIVILLLAGITLVAGGYISGA
ncbi:MAG: hypothetical protein M3082_05550 [Candidatus Dormibacteraeota bacterium]|nr:hypothetical protein [Candidatus Dormibacteraeota bacterium]